MAKKRAVVKTKTAIAATPAVLLAEVRQLILDARQQTYQAVNAALTFTNWRVGDRIRRNTCSKSERNTASRLSRRCRDNWKWNSDEGTRRNPSAI